MRWQLTRLLTIIFILGSAISAHAVTSERLVSTDGFVTDLLFSLGADEHLVAVDVTSQLPKGYRSLANIGYHRTLSAEGLLKLKPTKVIGSEHMGPKTVLSALKSANVKVTQLPVAYSVAQLTHNISTLASLVSKQAQAKQLLAEISRDLAELKRRPMENKRIAVVLSMDPQKLRLAGKGTSGNAFVSLLQGKNVANFKNFQTISAESLLSLQPELIVVIGRNKVDAVNELMSIYPILRNTPAGLNSMIVSVEGGALIAGLSPAAIAEALAVTRTLRGHEYSAVTKDVNR